MEIAWLNTIKEFFTGASLYRSKNWDLIFYVSLVLYSSSRYKFNEPLTVFLKPTEGILFTLILSTGVVLILRFYLDKFLPFIKFCCKKLENLFYKHQAKKKWKQLTLIEKNILKKIKYHGINIISDQRVSRDMINSLCKKGMLIWHNTSYFNGTTYTINHFVWNSIDLD